MKKADLRELIDLWRDLAMSRLEEIRALEERLACTQRLVARQAADEERTAPDGVVDTPIYSFRLGPPTGYRDPADTAKVGDTLPLYWDDFAQDDTCPAMDEMFACTRRPHSARQHVATVRRDVVHVWPHELDEQPLAEWEIQPSVCGPIVTTGSQTWCPRCDRDVVSLPPRRICTACEIEVGARPVPHVGMTINGNDARVHLPDGVVLRHVVGGLALNTVRVVGERVPGMKDCHRGVVDHATYRVESLPDADRDAATVAAAERYGDEIGQRDRTAAIEGAAITLRAHKKSVTHSGCICGWERESSDHARHVAEQLAVVGALGSVDARPVLVDDEGDRWVAVAAGTEKYRLERGDKTRDQIQDQYGPVREVAP